MRDAYESLDFKLQLVEDERDELLQENERLNKRINELKKFVDELSTEVFVLRDRLRSQK